MAKLISVVFGLITALCVVITFTGCGAETALPLTIQKLNGPSAASENSLMELDARGVVNGKYQPGDLLVQTLNFYPINYTGNWRLIKSYRGNLYTITSDEAGARVDVVATLSRLTFDFVDSDTYDNPGDVTFLIDGKPLGTFALNTKNPDGSSLMDYQIDKG